MTREASFVEIKDAIDWLDYSINPDIFIDCGIRYVNGQYQGWIKEKDETL